MTPITYSLKQAVKKDFLGYSGKKHIILLTDGGENCDESPCAYVMELIKVRKDIKIDVEDSIVDFIAKVGFDDNYGARPLKRAVQSKIEDKIAEEILDGNIKEGSHIILKAEEDKVIISLK